jgi:hypothetical protein
MSNTPITEPKSVYRRPRFSLPEVLIVIFVFVIVVLVGFFIFSRISPIIFGQTGEIRSSLSYKYTNLSTANSQEIVNDMNNAVTNNFRTVSSLLCNGSASSCQTTPLAGIALTINNGSEGPVRRVAGYDFFALPDSSASSQLDLQSDGLTSLQTVKGYINKLLDLDNLSSKTTQLNSVPEPIGSGTLVYRTYYNETSICELDEISADDLDLNCGPINTYLSTAKTLSPIYTAFIDSNTQFNDPQKTGLTLELTPNESADNKSYISNSQTAGYQVATLIPEVLTTKHTKYSSIDGNSQFFWSKGNGWNYLPNVPSQLSDGTNIASIPCAYKFPNSNALKAYIGQPCQEQNQGDTMSSFQ